MSTLFEANLATQFSEDPFEETGLANIIAWETHSHRRLDLALFGGEMLNQTGRLAVNFTVH